MSSPRTVLHLDLDTFFVSVERLMDSRLNGKPLLIGGTGDRGVVASCSYEARKFGVHSGMPMRMARELCPEALVIRGNSANYSKHSHAVTDIVREAVPVCEKSSIDEFYADLTGMDRFFGCWQYARELRERIIRETGLPISFGLSENKTVSKVATGEAKPNNALRIERGTERPFLAPLGIRKIPMVGEKTYQTLRNLGVRRIGTLQEMPVDMMERVLGKSGRTIWRKIQAKLYRLFVQNHRQFITAIELHPHLNAKTIPQRRGKQARTCGGTNQGKGRQINPHRTCRWPLADDKIKLEIFHCRI